MWLVDSDPAHGYIAFPVFWAGKNFCDNLSLYWGNWSYMQKYTLKNMEKNVDLIKIHL